MSSIGEFREKEIDGKPFYILTLLSQTNIPSSSGEATAIDSGGDKDDLSLHHPHFLCPNIRLRTEVLKLETSGISFYSSEVPYPLSIPPHFQNTQHSDKHQIKYYPVGSENFLNFKGPVFWFINNKNDYHAVKTWCGICGLKNAGDGEYDCSGCTLEIFHKECVEAPLEIKVHPSHPFLSLQLHILNFYVRLECVICETSLTAMAYICRISDVSMHPFCALNPIPIVIDHYKRHPHPLIFFPKQSSLACDICGMIKAFIPTYVCARCVFVVHQDCIYSPSVIRICRHQHRISFTSSPPSRNWSCGVCRKRGDNKHGAYSCNKCDDYFVHTRCALRRDVWDGEELEGVPEEPEVVVEPFVTIADGVILHVSHGHHLKLEISRVYDEYNCCHACVLPIYGGDYYSCVSGHCDFILHEECANAPLKTHNPLYARPLELKFVDDKGYFNCTVCRRKSCGFSYRNPPGGESFKLDLRCAAISEPFQYEGHEHPLFLALSPREQKSAKCHICVGAPLFGRFLDCVECNFILCYRCATLPYKARYKHDKHFLTFRKEAKVAASDKSGWCEACESKIVYSGGGGFYACDKYCNTTLHVTCLLGEDPYMRHGQTIFIYETNVHILRNNTMCRPFCYSMFCDGRRCQHNIIFKTENFTCCSYHCMHATIRSGLM